MYPYYVYAPIDFSLLFETSSPAFSFSTPFFLLRSFTISTTPDAGYGRLQFQLQLNVDTIGSISFIFHFSCILTVTRRKRSLWCNSSSLTCIGIPDNKFKRIFEPISPDRSKLVWRQLHVHNVQAVCLDLSVFASLLRVEGSVRILVVESRPRNHEERRGRWCTMNPAALVCLEVHAQ